MAVSRKARGWWSHRLDLTAIAVVLGGSAATAAKADEPLFGYVNATDLLPAGKSQIEQQVTLRESHARGELRLLETRSEFDYGLTDRLQVTGYLNGSHLDAPSGDVGWRLDSLTGEAIWRVWSPYLNPAGLAVLADVTAGRGATRVGLRAIGQKNFRDDTIVLAANLRGEFGGSEPLAPDPAGVIRMRDVTPVEATVGASWRFHPNWSAGLELRARAKFADGRAEYSDLLVGPTLHYGGQRWFLTLTALARVANHDRAQPTALDPIVSARDRTRLDGLRLRIGRTFQ